MIGVNIGVPVPREPFSFGGTKDSKFGVGDITGESGVAFWTKLKKITTKWGAPDSAAKNSGAPDGAKNGSGQEAANNAKNWMS
jgi:malonate-semialdehyde dehydrogenase (acetylating)/methylmalonate-semialdehyde dehydrogenase